MIFQTIDTFLYTKKGRAVIHYSSPNFLFSSVEPSRDIESPVHTRPAIARSASKKRRQQRADAGKMSPIKLDDTEEQEKKKVSRHISFAT